MVIPKIASRNILKAIITGSNSSNAKNSTLDDSQFTLTEDIAFENKKLEEAHTFTFIRNPWTRLYAGYRENVGSISTNNNSIIASKTTALPENIARALYDS